MRLWPASRTRLDGTHLDGKNPEPPLTAPALTARSTATTFLDKLTFLDEPPRAPPPQAQSSGKRREAQAQR